jgi:hypothetical protein
VYATCLFCKRSLGRNDALEHFPVGRRLAYDQAKGRLWVVCARCERWNLTPLETRWEAIEEAERSFRATRQRIATENVALARLKEGLELVRIGAPPRLELAGWRYGDQFGRRRRKRFALLGLGLVAPTLPLLGSATMGFAVLGGGGLIAYNAWDMWTYWKASRTPVVHVSDEAGEVLALTKDDAWTASLVPVRDSREWYLTVRYRERWPWDTQRSKLGQLRGHDRPYQRAIMSGMVAQRALAALMPHANAYGGSARTVRDAVQVIESSSSLDQLVYSAAAARINDDAESAALNELPARVRFALEMVLHEDDERRAMEGEIAALEQRWREAEEIASIADSLLVPAEAAQRFESLRQKNTELP